jgi:nitrile hydratase
MEGIADMGGTEGWGPAHPPRGGEPVFEEPWQGRAFALTHLSIGVSGQNVDAFRHALERLDRTAYLDDGYYGRWLNAAELMLTDSAILAPAAIDARARNLRGEHVADPRLPRPVSTADFRRRTPVPRAVGMPAHRRRSGLPCHRRWSPVVSHRSTAAPPNSACRPLSHCFVARVATPDR